MSKVMEEEFKRWTAKRKAALVMEISSIRKFSIIAAAQISHGTTHTDQLGEYEPHTRSRIGS